jgi:hypothetical protein
VKKGMGCIDKGRAAQQLVAKRFVAISGNSEQGRLLTWLSVQVILLIHSMHIFDAADTQHAHLRSVHAHLRCC